MLGVMLAATTMAVALPAQSVFASYNVGTSGPDVAEIQNELSDLGYYNGIPDGVYGADTAAAVKKYQASMGLEADGVVGDYTYSKLMGKRMPSRRSDYGVSRGYVYGYGANTGMVRSLISTAYDYVGVPYVFGGTTPWGLTAQVHPVRVPPNRGGYPQNG